MFTLPWAELYRLATDAGLPTDATPPLTMLVGRYNYGRHTPYDSNGIGGPELTMWPAQPRTNYHLRPSHAPLRFE